MRSWICCLGVCGALLIGCSDTQRQQGNEQTGGAEKQGVQSPASKGERTGTSATGENGEKSQGLSANERNFIEHNYGEIELKDFSALTHDWLLKNLAPEVIQLATGTPGAWTVQKAPSGDIVYERAEGGARVGRVRISIPLSELPILQMSIQAGINRQMVKEGKASEVNLEVPGVIGIIRDKSPGELLLFTRDRLILIDTGAMKGRDFDDLDAKREAAVKIAKEMLRQSVGSNAHSND